MSSEPLHAYTRVELEAEIVRLRSAANGLSIHTQDPDRATVDDRPEPPRERRTLIGSEARQRAIFESAVDFAIVATDRAGLVTDWNIGAERVMGWSAEEMFGHSAKRFFTPEDHATHHMEKEMARALTDGRAIDERWHMRKDGERFWASGEMTPLQDDDGHHIGFVKILRDRTEHHLAGIALEEAQLRYRLAAKATSDAVWDWDLVTNHLFWNEALATAYGHRPDAIEPTGDWWISQIHPDDRSEVETSIHAVIDGGGESWTHEYRFRKEDGSYAEVLDRGHVIRDAAGRAQRMIGAMLDVTRMRNAERALRRGEERFRTILDTIEAAFAIVEVKFNAADEPVDYRFVEANPAFERQAGIDLQGRWVTEFAPQLEPFWFETYGRVAKTRVPVSFENYADAFKRWFDVRAVPVGDPSERLIAILFTDVTARRVAAERLRESEALARENVQRVQLALAAGAIIGTWNWDLRTDRFTVDEAFAHSFGLDPALGREGIPLAQIVATVHPDDQAGLAEAIDEVIKRSGAYAHQYRVRRADGVYYWIEANGRVEHAADGTPTRFPGVLLDVQERRALAAERDRAAAALRSLNETLEQRVQARTAELMKAEEQLRQSQKMEAVGQLTGGLAHDFNNLLAGISGSLEMMQKRIEQKRFDELGRYMSGAQGAAKRAAALTHRLLAFSRRQTLEPKPTDPNRLIAGMEDLIRRTVGPAVNVETFFEPAVWSTLVDPNQLENALLNLCINARDAMPDGGRLLIEARNRTIDTHFASQTDIPAGDYVSLSVSDNGVGMAPEIVERVFEPFFTTKPIGVGTGLGLSMIFGFAKQSNGQVRIHSEVGRGTSVTILLPRHSVLETGEHTDQTPGATPTAQLGKTVLVVDDEPLVRMLIVDVLEDLGCTVIEAGDGPQAMAVLRSDRAIDLLVTDVGLPNGMNGRQVADAARELRRGLKVLFVTGYAENAILSHGHLGPEMEVITKPFLIETIAERIRALIKD